MKLGRKRGVKIIQFLVYFLSWVKKIQISPKLFQQIQYIFHIDLMSSEGKT
jgi:hypothetical protein